MSAVHSFRHDDFRTRRWNVSTRRVGLFILVLALFVSAWMKSSHAATCSPLNPPALVFSPYNPITNWSEDIETTIEFSCAPAFIGDRLHISISLIENSQSAGYQIRSERGDVIRYGIFADPARSIPLNSSMNIPIRDVNVQNKTFRIVLYGRIFASQRIAGVGKYLGNLNLLLNY